MSMAQISKQSDSVWNSRVNHMGLIGFFLSLLAVISLDYRCIVAAVLVVFINNRSAMCACVACDTKDTRPCDRRSTPMDK